MARVIFILYLFIIPGLRFPLQVFNGYSEYSFSAVNPKIHQLSDGAKQLVNAAFEGLDSNMIKDYHTHIVGIGYGNTGNYVNEEMLSNSHLFKHLKFKVYLNAAGIKDSKKADTEYLQRLVELIRAIPHHGKYCLLAFDQNYNPDGTPNLKKTEFFVPNDYVFWLAEKYPDLFIPVISIHPYRKDALSELERWARKGVRMVKWLPNAMGIDPSSELCKSYYRKMKDRNLILLTHAGEEKAVESEEDQKFGNPLLLKAPLNAGVKVIVAHCASLGEETVRDVQGKMIRRKNFDLFMELMNEKKYEGLLFADISALTQFNRMGKPLTTMLDHTEMHSRLVNGSDYPLPAINILIRTGSLEKGGYITPLERKYLNEIFEQNPLLFDFVLKRTIRSPITKRKFSPKIFMSNSSLGF